MRIVFGKQLTFGFDDQDRQSSLELIGCVDRHRAEGDDILLAALMEPGNRPDGVSKDRAISLIADLIRDDQIRLATGTQRLDKVAALAVLRQPHQWLDKVVMRAAVVDPPMLAKVRQAATGIFDTAAPAEQSELCGWIRKQLRAWINASTSFQRLADAENYPGKADMLEIIDIADQLMAIHDPCLFIEKLNGQACNLTTLARSFDSIRVFYDDHSHIWQSLNSAMAKFRDNAAALERDPRCRKEFCSLQKLFRSRQPFAANPAILDEIAHVRSVHRQIIYRHVRETARAARPKIEAMLAELRQALDRADAHNHLRNQVLYPLQRLHRLLDTAQTATRVAELLTSAQDDFDVGLDIIGYQHHRPTIDPGR